MFTRPNVLLNTRDAYVIYKVWPGYSSELYACDHNKYMVFVICYQHIIKLFSDCIANDYLFEYEV